MLLIEVAGLVSTSDISISLIAALTLLVHAIIDLKWRLMEVGGGGRFSLLSGLNQHGMLESQLVSA